VEAGAAQGAVTPTEFYDALIAYCTATGGSQTSGGRTRKHNFAVGGVVDSAHLLWVAADVVYDQDDPHAWRDRMASRVGLRIIRDEPDHDHLQPA
jgi:hypothetical protein